MSLTIYHFLNETTGNYFSKKLKFVRPKFLRMTFYFSLGSSFFSFQRYGKFYLKAAKNSLEKGADYAKNEIQRLERILEKVLLYMAFLVSLWQ